MRIKNATIMFVRKLNTCIKGISIFYDKKVKSFYKRDMVQIVWEPIAKNWKMVILFKKIETLQSADVPV